MSTEEQAQPTEPQEPQEPQEEYSADDEAYVLRRRRHKEGDLISGLNLTAMMDMMTIILVFLIQQYANAPENINPSGDLQPPKSTAEQNIVPAARLTITKTSILVEDKVVLSVQEGHVVGSDPKTALQPLNDALESRVKILKAISDAGGAPFDGNLMVIADEDTPYDLVSTSLLSAGRAGFSSYRLIVRRGGHGK